MRAHLVQFDIAWEDASANFARVDALLGGVVVDEGDLVVLPELFDSGFSLNTDRTADREGRTAAYLLRLADDLGCVVQGARTVRDCTCARARNEALVVAPEERVLARYQKIHPFTYGREPEAFDGGEAVVTFAWGGLTVCPAICYDLRFPELFRAGLAMGAEAYTIGANWPAARAGHWRALLIARAIENQAWVLGVNRVGSDPFLGYAGGSIAVDPQGRVVGELGADEGVLSVEIDREAVRAWRATFPAWRDGRIAIGTRAGAG